MTAVNAVRFRVKPGREEEFVAAHRNMKEAFPGMRRAILVKTGDRTYCMVGIWDEMKQLTDARSAMIANLDKVRDCLEDLGGGLGVTDPVSGEAVVEMRGGKGGKGGKGKKAGGGAGAGGAAAAGGGGANAKREERKAKKKAERKAARKAGGGTGGKKK